MLAGQQPFRGENLLSLADAIRTNDPSPLTGDASSLDGAVSRALSKDAGKRHQTVADLLGDLSQIHDLRVISRTSVMQLKNTSKDLRTIGRDLNVRHVLEGSVRKAGNDLRITAQLMDATTDAHLWAAKFKGRWTTCSTFRNGCLAPLLRD